ncbi:MAG: hypothetical protein HQK55_04250 [Deltaproteobacteria bacterium]|nr:hypothetical protein [Deltaproteobacteria bacterium]
MMTLVGGIVALILGVIGLFVWWDPFLRLLQAGIPLVLILGGALATYLGIEEWKDSKSLAEPGLRAPDPEVERYKAEAEKYKSELEALKGAQPTGGAEKPSAAE